jgi:hypothetical protein
MATPVCGAMVSMGMLRHVIVIAAAPPRVSDYLRVDVLLADIGMRGLTVGDDSVATPANSARWRR